LIIALTAGTLTACSPDVDKLEEKIIDQTEQVENKIKALKELNAQYKTLKVIVSQKQTVAQAGTKMHNNIRNDQQELRKMEKKLREESKKIDTQLEEIKTLRVEFTNAGGDITTLGEYPNFDITIQGLENEFQSIKLP
jgi:chromosome segregation ATPase